MNRIKYNASNQPASALLISIIVAMILLTSLTVLWRAVSLSYESTMLHYKSKQNFYACESLMIYAIGLIQQELVLLNQLKIDQKEQIYQGDWPKQSKTWGVLTVLYRPKLQQVELQAKLFGNNHLEPLLTTTVLCQKKAPKNQKLLITSWRNS